VLHGNTDTVPSAVTLLVVEIRRNEPSAAVWLASARNRTKKA
jgi:hypothetical protein